jgi:hypothetical protein
MLACEHKQLFGLLGRQRVFRSCCDTLTVQSYTGVALTNSQIGPVETVSDLVHGRAFSRMRRIEASTSSWGLSSVLAATLSMREASRERAASASSVAKFPATICHASFKTFLKVAERLWAECEHLHQRHVVEH